MKIPAWHLEDGEQGVILAYAGPRRVGSLHRDPSNPHARIAVCSCWQMRGRPRLPDYAEAELREHVQAEHPGWLR